MKKSDLEYGNVVEVRNGDKYLFDDDDFINLIGYGYLPLDNYHKDLTDVDGDIEFDIMKVYKDYTLTELLWERKETPKPNPKLTEDEKVILRNVPKYYKWIARDINGSLYVYASKPKKRNTMWESYGSPMVPFVHLFNFIKWEDDEPYSIQDLLKGE